MTTQKIKLSEKTKAYTNALQGGNLDLNRSHLIVQCIISGRQGSGKSLAKSDLQHAILKHARQWAKSVSLKFSEVQTNDIMPKLFDPTNLDVILMLERMIEVIQDNADIKKMDREDKRAVSNVKKFLKSIDK